MVCFYRERMEWLKKGRDRIFQQKCKAINRYEVLGISPLKIILVIETDDLKTLLSIYTPAIAFSDSLSQRSLDPLFTDALIDSIIS